MNKPFLYDNFIFANYKFTDYHYFDNRKGAPLNYLAYLQKGEAKLVTDNKTLYIKENEVFYIPKNLSYQSYWYGPEIDFLSFGFLELHTADKLKFELQKVNCDNALINKIKTIPVNSGGLNCKALSVFYDVMSEVLPKLEYNYNNHDEFLVNKIKKCIRENLFASMTEIAKMCSVSEPHLYYLFNKHEKTTPNEYRQKLLCEMSINLLITTDKKVEEISRMMNFCSSSYFRKVLKKHTGSTPREIRKNGI